MLKGATGYIMADGSPININTVHVYELDLSIYLWSGGIAIKAAWFL